MDRLQEIMVRIAQGYGGVRRTLPLVLDDPREYPREAMLLAIIAGLVLILVVSAGMAIYEGVTEWLRARKAGVRVRRRRGYVVALVAASVVVIALVVAAQLPALVAVSPACGACHVMKPRVAAWQAGPHASAGCWGCHASPSVLGRVGASVSEVARWATPVSRGTGIPVSSAGCLRCHEEILDGTIRSSRVIVQHSDFIEAGLECIECHPTVGHQLPAEPKTTATIPRTPMTTCLLCHDGVKAPAGCPTCHIGRPSDMARAPAPGAAATPPGCSSTCHEKDQERCTDCHGIEMPHPVDFKRVHAETSADDPLVCTKCHENATAAQACGCHPDGATHGSYSVWYKQHGPQAAASGPGGCLCHDNNGYQMCLKCHESSPW